MADIDENTHQERIRAALDSLLADITELHTQFKALTAKLDADGGITDTDYAATVDPADLTTTT